MKKMLLVLLAFLFLGAVESMAQQKGWVFKRVFYRQSGFTVPHGVAVTPDGKIWLCANIKTPDTLGARTSMKSVYVMNPDGSIHRKIQTISVGGVTDTLTVGARGIYAGIDGNVLYCAGTAIYKINYQTYEGMGKYATTFSLTQPAQLDDGTVVVGPVSNGNPVLLLLEDLTFPIGNMVDTTFQIARTLAVTGDGYNLFLGSTTGPGVIHYRSTDLVKWAPFDTLVRGMDVESMNWRKGKLWFSNFAGAAYKKNAWFEYDFSSKTLTDSIVWDTTGFTLPAKPRGIAFSLGGDTAYVVGSDANAIEEFVYSDISAIRRDELAIPDGYELDQNYPNPFNPTTDIRFSVGKMGPVTLMVYDVLGREVATLVNEDLPPGVYTARFDASGLSTGTYVYVLTADGLRMSKKMLLAK